MQLDLSIESLSWDNAQAVTLEVAARAAPDLVAVARAKQRAIRNAQRSPSGGVYLGYEVTWHIPKRELPEDVIPVPADTIVEDDTRWTVLTVAHNRAGETYACGCVDLVLAFRLSDTISIERARIDYDSAGVPAKVFPPDGGRNLATLKARVQAISSEPAQERGLRYGRERYTVTIERQVRDIDTAEDRIRWVDRGTTRYLDILAVRQPERIDELPQLECEERA